MIEFDPYSRIVDSNPFPLYKDLRDNDPCHWSKSGDCWVITRYDDILACNQNWEVFSSAGGNMLDDKPERAGNTLGTTDPPRHDRLRMLIQAAFMRRSIAHLEQTIEAVAHKYLDVAESNGEIDFISGYSSPVTISVLSNMLGIGTEDRVEVRRNVINFLQTDPVKREKTESQHASFEWLKNYAAVQIEDRTRKIAEGHPGSDLITALIEAEIDGLKLAETEILMTSLTLVMAGLESGSSFLAMMGLNLADHPNARAELVANPELIPQAVEESLRFNTSAQRFRRTIAEDFELHGKKLKTGDKVLMCYGAGNRDERRYPDPDKYDIHRNPKQHLGLGVGKHVCIGAQVARMLSKHATKVFLERFPNYQRQDDDLDWIASTTFRSPVQLNVSLF